VMVTLAKWWTEWRRNSPTACSRDCNRVPRNATLKWTRI
jgi:hypothetical protein